MKFIEDMFDPELGYDAATERLRDLHDAFEKRIKWDESEFAMKVWCFYRYFIWHRESDVQDSGFRSIPYTKKLRKELIILIYKFHQAYPGNEYHWSRKEFNAELCAEALINFIKEHESELSSEFVNRARLELEELEKSRPKKRPPQTEEQKARCEQILQKIREEQERIDLEIERQHKLQEELRKEYEAKRNSETAWKRFKTILRATIRIYF